MALGTKLGILASSGVAAFENDYSIAFDGTDDYANGTANFTTWNGLQNVSVNLWFKRDDVTRNEMLMSQYGTGGNSFYIYCVGNARVDFYLDGGVRYRYTGTTFTNNTWYNLGFSYDGTQGTSADRPSLYLNGSSRLAGSFGGNATLGTYTSDLQMSGRDGTNFELAGNLDEISIWTSTLTEANHNTIYNSGTPLDISTLGISGLAHWWRGGDNNGGTGTTMSDAVGSYNINYFNADTAFEADVP
tara:strand:+ start:171 stop:905 length:735 start_codon:yes stop_codon:yes gene_type:complete